MRSVAVTGDVSQWLEAHAARDRERLFLETVDGRRMSYGDMVALTTRLAAVLRSLQVAPGDRVVAQVEKSPEAVALYLACLQLGAVFVPLNTAYTFAELEYFLGDAEPSLAVVRPADQAQVQSIAQRCGVAHVETLDERGGGSLLSIVTTEQPANSSHHPSSSLAALLYTSGTTGRSKGAML